MAFDLKRILLALLFSSSEALSVKDIQGVVTRYHQQETAASDDGDRGGADDGEAESDQETEGESGAETESDGNAGEAAEPEEPDAGPDRNGAVPSLVTATQIREAMEAIQQELDESNQVFQLIEGHNGYRLVARAEFASWIRCLRGEPRPARLSQAALETLAVVAYRQPVTRAEIETIRGVSADGALNRLLERELIEVMGRAELPGRPIQYGVTEKFLDFVGVKSLDELPASDVLSPRQIDEWIQQAANPALVSDKEVGLETEEEPQS